MTCLTADPARGIWRRSVASTRAVRLTQGAGGRRHPDQRRTRTGAHAGGLQAGGNWARRASSPTACRRDSTHRRLRHPRAMRAVPRLELEYTNFVDRHGERTGRQRQAGSPVAVRCRSGRLRRPQGRRGDITAQSATVCRPQDRHLAALA
ncbi:hypothetical protein LV779_12635 [Streptomyces thinghirensis]|nr:hypothetical protein [Streptomyces thinghirensis]